MYSLFSRILSCLSINYIHVLMLKTATPLAARVTLPRRYLIKLPAPGSDPTVVEAKGPEAGQRYVVGLVESSAS
jgi:hypothetical protein